MILPKPRFIIFMIQKTKIISTILITYLQPQYLPIGNWGLSVLLATVNRVSNNMKDTFINNKNNSGGSTKKSNKNRKLEKRKKGLKKKSWKKGERVKKAKGKFWRRMKKEQKIRKWKIKRLSWDKICWESNRRIKMQVPMLSHWNKLKEQ